MPKDISRLQPAHARVLDLLLRAPRMTGEVNAAWIAERCHWSQNTVWMLLREARQFYRVDTTEELAELWRRNGQ